MSYRCSLPSPLQKRSKDQKGLHWCQNPAEDLLASTLKITRSSKTMDTCGALNSRSPLLGSGTNAILFDPWIFSAMAMAMSIYRTLCVLVFLCFPENFSPRDAHFFWQWASNLQVISNDHPLTSHWPPRTPHWPPRTPHWPPRTPHWPPMTFHWPSFDLLWPPIELPWPSWTFHFLVFFLFFLFFLKISLLEMLIAFGNEHCFWWFKNLYRGQLFNFWSSAFLFFTKKTKKTKPLFWKSIFSVSL